ncbi:LysR family transcriptional regulator [Roseibium sp. RKSG952]|uniref:LysR family transcriptional regulator n=1 Tax=Roseibium sp. RKSG952 TaxID=2529384 RepID=UPI0012BCC9C2|nr:LysR family transcriptional regulator [Roseibium sp. RKSG952]MTH97950.1 LysR family transcriptional regulator [Roseibium sp. RKSG952]
MYDDTALFVHIVRQQGLAAAAAQLKLAAPTVTRRLRRLEEALGCRLIHRSARTFQLTNEGESYYAAFAELVDQFDSASRQMSRDRSQMSGKLVVSAPTNISVGILQPMWSAFVVQYPDVRLDLRLSTDLEDMERLQIDMALRIGPQPDSQLSQKRLGHIATVVVAAPSYLEAAGNPAVPEELYNHRIISVRPLPIWRLEKDEEAATFRPESFLSVDDIALASQFAADGLGLALLPVSEIVRDLESGRLVRVLPRWQGPRREIYAIWPSGRLLSARASALRDFMQHHIAGLPVLRGAVPESGELC